MARRGDYGLYELAYDAVRRNRDRCAQADPRTRQEARSGWKWAITAAAVEVALGEPCVLERAQAQAAGGDQDAQAILARLEELDLARVEGIREMRHRAASSEERDQLVADPGILRELRALLAGERRRLRPFSSAWVGALARLTWPETCGRPRSGGVRSETPAQAGRPPTAARAQRRSTRRWLASTAIPANGRSPRPFTS